MRDNRRKPRKVLNMLCRSSPIMRRRTTTWEYCLIGKAACKLRHSSTDKRLRFGPEYPDAHYNLALLLFNEGHIKEAIDEYQLTLLYAPENAKAHNNLGIVLKRTGALPEAIEQFKLALELESNSFQAHYNLADAFMQLQRPQDAIEQFQQALQYEPNDVDSLVGLATCYALLHRSADAIATAERALAAAQAQGLTKPAAKIAAWLNQYRLSHPSASGTGSPAETGAPNK